MKSPRFATFHAVLTRNGGIIAIFREKETAEIFAVGRRGRVLPWLLPSDSFAWDEEVINPVAGDHAICDQLRRSERFG